MSRRNEPSRLISEPEVGFFKIRLCRGGPWVAAAITKPFGCYWKATINGHDCGAMDPDPTKADGIFRIWSTGVVITKAEYTSLLAKPPISPDKPIAIGTLPTPF